MSTRVPWFSAAVLLLRGIDLVVRLQMKGNCFCCNIVYVAVYYSNLISTTVSAEVGSVQRFVVYRRNIFFTNGKVRLMQRDDCKDRLVQTGWTLVKDQKAAQSHHFSLFSSLC